MTAYVWKGSGAGHTGTWETAADWTPVGVPGDDDTVTIGVGVVTEDVNQPVLLPNNTINPGVEVATLHVSAGAELDIGDAGGTNYAIVTLTGTAANTVGGTIVVNSGGSSGSEFRVSGTLQVAKGGAIDIDDGKLLALGTLALTGVGTISMDGGYIGGSSANKSDTLNNRATISGVGALSAANYYAAPPATPLSGPLNYNGLITNNYGTIEATNLASGANYFVIAGGVVNNYGTIEATNSVSGSSGYAALDSDEGATIFNEVDGVIAAETGAFVTLGGSVANSGGLLVDGGFMTFTGALTSTGAATVENSGFLTFDVSVTFAGALTVDANSAAVATGTITTSSPSSVGAIDLDGGFLTAYGTLTLAGKGAVNLDGGTIDGSSSNTSNTLANYLTIAGAGYISGYVTDGGGNYNGLVTNNRGTIDATNLVSGGNFLTLTGGTTNNYGTLEATNSVSGSGGYAVLASTDDATIVNQAAGQILATSGAYVALDMVTNRGSVIANGGVASFDDKLVSTGTLLAENGGMLEFDASATISSGVTMENDGSVVASGTLATTVGSASGTISVGDGSMFALGTLNLTGQGAITIDGGQIGGSSVDATNTVNNHLTISGVGSIDAYNDYSGTGAYNGLVTNNYGVINATNIDDGLNVMAIVGGLLNNYGTLETNNSVSGSSGTADIFIDFGAEVVNIPSGSSTSGVLSAGTGSAIVLDGGTIDNGELIGNLLALGTGDVIESTGSKSEFTNTGTIDVLGALTILGGAGGFSNSNARVEVDSGGSLTLKGSIYSGAGGVIAVDGGTLTAAAGSSISDALGQLVVGENGTGGSATLNIQLLQGDGVTTIDSGYLTIHANVASPIDIDDGVLAIGSGGGVTGYITFSGSGGIDINNEAFNSGLTGTFYQSSGASGLLTFSDRTFAIMGDYQTVGTTTTFGAGSGSASGFALQADANNHNYVEIVR